MNNGYQNFNGCGADKEGGKIFNTFFYLELQSKHVSPLATNVLRLGEGCQKNNLIINRDVSGGYCKTAVSRWPFSQINIK